MGQGLDVGIAWYGRLRKTSQPSSATAMWAVRRDWPDGSHELVRARVTEAEARQQLAGERVYWRRGPVHPALSVVPVSAREFRLHGLHRRLCYAPDCASAAAQVSR